MDRTRWLVFGLVLTAGLAVIQTARLALSRLGPRWRRARRFARARRGEKDAEKLLRRAGYRVVSRQVQGTARYEVDGEPLLAEVRADLLVTRRGASFVAEVKTGTKAPKPATVATRRQLLEYAQAFDVDGLLLVDADAGKIFEVCVPSRPRPGRAAWLFTGLVLGAAISAWWLEAR